MFCFKYFVYIFQTQAGKYYSVKYVPEKYHFFETKTDRLYFVIVAMISISNFIRFFMYCHFK